MKYLLGVMILGLKHGKEIMDGNLKIVILLPIGQIENWIWKIFCPGKEDCEKLNNLHPKNYPPLCMRFFVHRSAARTTPPRLCNLHKRLDPLLLVNVQFAQTCKKRKKPLAIPFPLW